MIGLIGKKIGMTRQFIEDGESIPVTAILAGPCYVVQVKSRKKEGYGAVQLGAFDRRKKLIKKSQLGQFAKAKIEPKAKLAEFRVKNTDLYQTGQELCVNIFQVGEKVKITGRSKGRGFAGGVKRWHFKGGPKTHGQSDRHRAPGSMGGSSYPSRVWKGQRMAGRMGYQQVSIRNLEVIRVDIESNIILVKGSVPGARNSYIFIQRTTEMTSLPAVSQKSEEMKAQKGIKKEVQKVESGAESEKDIVTQEKATQREQVPATKAERPSEKLTSLGDGKSEDSTLNKKE